MTTSTEDQSRIGQAANERAEAARRYVQQLRVFYVHAAVFAGVEIHPQRVTKLFDEVLKRTGASKIRLHDLRHTMASLAIEAGVHPKVVQEQLGHSAIVVTLDNHSHVPQAVRRDSADKIAGFFCE